MKTIRIIALGAGILALAACSRVQTPEQVSTFTFQAYADGASPDLRATVGLSNEGKPQTFWENGDQITVYSSGVNTNASVDGFVFSTTLSEDSPSASFSYAGDDFVTGNYLAIYPAATAKRVVNFTGTDIYKMAAVDVPASQTLVAGGFDRSAAVATAYAEEGSTSLAFKNATALLKFRVSDADVISGRIVAEGSDISGRFRADLSTSTLEPVLTKYNQPTNNYVDFALDGAAFQTETDYYVAVRPTELASGFSVYLNGEKVKSFTAEQVSAFERNKIYNLGVLTMPQVEVEKLTLEFDFSGDPLDGWPTADKWKTAPGELSCVYPLDGVNYTFILTDCGNATSARVAWVKGSGLVLYAVWRYVGLPALAGYKLTTVTGVMSLSSKARQAAITTSVVENNATDQNEYVAGGSPMQWNTQNTAYTFNLEGTTAGTVYYLSCTQAGLGVSSLTLTYEKVD